MDFSHNNTSLGVDFRNSKIIQASEKCHTTDEKKAEETRVGAKKITPTPYSM